MRQQILLSAQMRESVAQAQQDPGFGSASATKSGHCARALGSPVREMGSVHPRAGKWKQVNAISARLESFNWSCMVVVVVEMLMLMAIVLLVLRVVMVVVVLVILLVVAASLSWYSAQDQRQDNARVNPNGWDCARGWHRRCRVLHCPKNLFQS